MKMEEKNFLLELRRRILLKKRVGWLSSWIRYKKGNVSQEFLDCLWEYILFPINQNRCLFTCPLCTNLKNSKVIFTYKGAKVRVGNAEIWVFDEKMRKVYIAPDAILHYIPPKRFIEAVLRGPKPTTEIYKKKIQNFVYSEKKKKKDMTFIRKMQKEKGYQCKNCFQFFGGMIAYEIIEKETEEKMKCQTVAEYHKNPSDKKKYKWICKNCCSYLEEKESI
jgi:uncharacterized protein (UPF0179 family)